MSSCTVLFVLAKVGVLAGEALGFILTVLDGVAFSALLSVVLGAAGLVVVVAVFVDDLAAVAKIMKNKTKNKFLCFFNPTKVPKFTKILYLSGDSYFTEFFSHKILILWVLSVDKIFIWHPQFFLQY